MKTPLFPAIAGRPWPLLAVLILTASPPASGAKWNAPQISVDFFVGGHRLLQTDAPRNDAFVQVPRWGVEYEIQITNHESRDRVLFVVGVDGLSIMDGRPASQHSGGYVLGPGQSHRIRGWRRGNDRVAAFTFTPRGDSYAHRMGKRGHVGEIWVWAIREKPVYPAKVVRPGPTWPQAEGARRSAALNYEGDTGTGYGEELADRVRTTTFDRSRSTRHLTFRYGLGPTVIPYGHKPENVYPELGEGSFTPGPPGWRERKK